MIKDQLKEKIRHAIRTRQMDYDEAVEDAVEEIMNMIDSYEILTKNTFCNCTSNSNNLVLSTTVLCTKCNKEAKNIRF